MDQLDQTITDSLAAGRIDADAAQTLRDKLNDLRDSVGRGRVRKQAEAMKRTIDQLLNDNEIDQSTADRISL